MYCIDLWQKCFQANQAIYRAVCQIKINGYRIFIFGNLNVKCRYAKFEEMLEQSLILKVIIKLKQIFSCYQAQQLQTCCKKKYSGLWNTIY